MNAKQQYQDWNSDYYHGKASDCVKCEKCEKVCPQHLEIRNLLEKVAEVLKK